MRMERIYSNLQIFSMMSDISTFSRPPSHLIKNIIFDFGGVLVDWNPRYYFKNYFNDDVRMEFFLKNIAVDEWNAEQDRGRTTKEGTEMLVELHPEWENEIRGYYDNWTTMLRADIPENVAVLRKLA